MKKLLSLLLVLLLLTGCTLSAPAPEAVTPPESSAQTQPAVPSESPAETVSKEGMLIVHFIDVGQADCALVECDGKAMLIDGGNTEDGWIEQDGTTALWHLPGDGEYTLTAVSGRRSTEFCVEVTITEEGRSVKVK